jgi:hypothetical protein
MAPLAAPGPENDERTVTVPATRYATVTLHFDTGMR